LNDFLLEIVNFTAAFTDNYRLIFHCIAHLV